MTWTRDEVVSTARGSGMVLAISISTIVLSHYGVDGRWNFLVIAGFAAAFGLWFGHALRKEDRSVRRRAVVFGVPVITALVLFGLTYLGVAGRWGFVAIAVVYTLWFSLDRRMHTRTMRSYGLYVAAFWTFVPLAFTHASPMWGFLALAVALGLFSLDQRRVAGEKVRRWPPPTAPAETKRLYLYGDACFVGGIASIIAGLATPISGFILFSFVLFASGAYLRYNARRVWKAAERESDTAALRGNSRDWIPPPP